MVFIPRYYFSGARYRLVARLFKTKQENIMGFIFLMLMCLVVSFLMGFVPILGALFLGFGIESVNWEAKLRQVPDRPSAINRILFILVAVSGLVFSSYVFYEPAPLGLARYEPVPGMTLTQLVIFVIAFALARSKRA